MGLTHARRPVKGAQINHGRGIVGEPGGAAMAPSRTKVGDAVPALVIQAPIETADANRGG